MWRVEEIQNVPIYMAPYYSVLKRQDRSLEDHFIVPIFVCLSVCQNYYSQDHTFCI